MFGFKKKQPEEAKKGVFSRLRQGLSKTHDVLTTDIGDLIKGQIDDELLDELETRLLSADVGMDVTLELVDELRDRVKRKDLDNSEALSKALFTHMTQKLERVEAPLIIDESKTPFVILVVGINGAGKTTTIGKLAQRFKNQGKSVMLAAGDTFRAAAVEQLQTWGERNNVPVIAQGTGADTASVIFDAMQAAKARNIDILLADTAGRLHTQDNLMEELKKVKRVINKQDDSAPHEILLVLDAGIGQNALNQAKQFHAAMGLTGLAITKLDGTAKGGILFAIAHQLGIPLRFIGVGEGIDDLQDFHAESFVHALLGSEE